jgi:hypothetical protein
MAAGRETPMNVRVVAADFEQPGDNDVVHKVTRDLAAGSAGALFPVLVHVLGHLQMVLQRRQGLPGPILQLRVVAALRVTFE